MNPLEQNYFQSYTLTSFSTFTQGSSRKRKATEIIEGPERKKACTISSTFFQSDKTNPMQATKSLEINPLKEKPFDLSLFTKEEWGEEKQKEWSEEEQRFLNKILHYFLQDGVDPAKLISSDFWDPMGTLFPHKTINDIAEKTQGALKPVNIIPFDMEKIFLKRKFQTWQQEEVERLTQMVYQAVEEKKFINIQQFCKDHVHLFPNRGTTSLVNKLQDLRKKHSEFNTLLRTSRIWTEEEKCRLSTILKHMSPHEESRLGDLTYWNAYVEKFPGRTAIKIMRQAMRIKTQTNSISVISRKQYRI